MAKSAPKAAANPKAGKAAGFKIPDVFAGSTGVFPAFMNFPTYALSYI